MVFGRLPETHPRRIRCLGCNSHEYSPSRYSTDFARPASSHEGCSVRHLWSGALDRPSYWIGDCNWCAFYGLRRVTGSPMVSRARCSCRSHLWILHVASPSKGTGGRLNCSTGVPVKFLWPIQLLWTKTSTAAASTGIERTAVWTVPADSQFESIVASTYACPAQRCSGTASSRHLRRTGGQSFRK